MDMAGAPELLDKTIAMAKHGSRIVLTAVYPAPVSLDLQGLLIREVSLIPAVGYSTEPADALKTLENVEEALAPCVSHAMPSALLPRRSRRPRIR